VSLGGNEGGVQTTAASSTTIRSSSYTPLSLIIVIMREATYHITTPTPILWLGIMPPKLGAMHHHPSIKPFCFQPRHPFWDGGEDV